jgi:hypothetical protein
MLVGGSFVKVWGGSFNKSSGELAFVHYSRKRSGYPLDEDVAPVSSLGDGVSVHYEMWWSGGG